MDKKIQAEIFVDGHGMCEVWSLPKVAPKKQRAGKYVHESFVHPAKMDTVLCRKIIETYTEQGETVLDPMAGIGTTLVESVLLSRNAVGVELEKKFCDLTKKNIKLLKKLKTSAPKGKAVVIKGDSRELSKLLGEKADVAVFSPPYTDGFRSNPKVDFEKRFKKLKEAEKRSVEKGQKWALSSDETIRRSVAKQDLGYSSDPNNIGNLKYGKPVDAVVTSPPFFSTVQERGYQGQGKHNIAVDPTKHGHKGIITLYAQSRENIDNIEKYGRVDAIVTSPPFKTANEGGGLNKNPPKTFRGVLKKHSFKLSGDPRNVDNLPYGKGVDSVIFSPPYSNIRKGDASEERLEKKAKAFEKTRNEDFHTPGRLRTIKRFLGETGFEDRRNISNLPHGKVDSIITSPPYEESMSPRRHKGKGGILERDEKLGLTGQYDIREDSTNIGNQKGETYLRAMLQVYRECYKTLKPGGKMVLVLKDFVRNKKVVRLDLDTKKLVEGCGFRWVETKLFRLPSKSFWRVLYERRYPEVDTSLLKFEFVEVFEKPLEACA